MSPPQRENEYTNIDIDQLEKSLRVRSLTSWWWSSCRRLVSLSLHIPFLARKRLGRSSHRYVFQCWHAPPPAEETVVSLIPFSRFTSQQRCIAFSKSRTTYSVAIKSLKRYNKCWIAEDCACGLVQPLVLLNLFVPMIFRFILQLLFVPTDPVFSQSFSVMPN